MERNDKAALQKRRSTGVPVFLGMGIVIFGLVSLLIFFDSQINEDAAQKILAQDRKQFQAEWSAAPGFTPQYLVQSAPVLLMNQYPRPMPTGTTAPAFNTPRLPTTVATSVSPPTATPTVPPIPFDGSFYIVQPGDSLEEIAQVLHVPEDNLRKANFMLGDAVLEGQKLAVLGPNDLPDPVWRYASLDLDLLNLNYPLLLHTARFRLHYMPQTYPAVDPNAVAGMMEHGVAFVEDFFGKPIDYPFDIYVAGTLYEPPNKYLRGRSFSKEHKILFLHDGSGDAVHQQYLAAHEITHMYTWNRYGQPFSFLLSEGVAVYAGMEMIAGSKYLPINTFCAAFQREGKLPLLHLKTELFDFRGHNNNLVNYYASGCLVGYLIETYGLERFGQLYGTQDFEAIYGKSLEALEAEWKAQISVGELPKGLDAKRLIASTERFMQANDNFYNAFNGTDQSLEVYRALDNARLALLSGNFDQFDVSMAQVQNWFSP